jgi:ABC-type branched-subunit amino acid transport system substrate-binding protein
MMSIGRFRTGEKRTPARWSFNGKGAVVALGLLLAGCAGTGIDSLINPAPEPEALTPGAQPGSDTIGNGQVKIALILPLSAPNGQVPAQSLRNAAELAVADFSGGSNSNIQILIRDDKGTPEGAREATQQAIAAGAELIMGPLFAPSVQAAAQVARQAGKPMIAFSSDVGVAQRGVYLLSFLPQSDVQRVVSFASSRGKRAIAGLLPSTPYGNVVEAELMSSGNQGGRRVVMVERYQPGNAASINAAVAKIKASQGNIDTLMLGEGADGIEPVLNALAGAGITGRNMQFVSTGIWNDGRASSIPQLDGAWFAAPDNTRFTQLAGRYQQRYGSAPTRIATLSYDATTLASALAQNFGAQRFAEQTLTNPNGFAGQDGVFRFRQTGQNDRGIAVYEIRSGSARAISPAPQSFTGN